MVVFGLFVPIWLFVIICAAGVFAAVILGLFVWGLFAYKRYAPCDDKKKYAFFIPARNEENVIANVIKSIRAMNYPQELITIFVLANNCSDTDRTAAIAGELGEEVFELNDPAVTNVGMVLDRFFEYVKERYNGFNAFDGYVRLDADNTVDKDFMNKFNDAFCANPTVITGYRDNSNYNAGIRASLTGTQVYSCMTVFRVFSSWGVNPILNGPGVLIGAEVLTKLGGLRCHTFSEDVELSVLLIKHKIKAYFCRNAVFYDEQAAKIKLIFRQRLRWTTGGWQLFCKYWFTMVARVFSRMWKSAVFLAVGLLPVGFISVTATLAFGIYGAVMSFLQVSFMPFAMFLIITFAINFIPVWFASALTMLIERKRIKVSFWKKAVYVFFSPFAYIIHMLSDFIRIFIRVKWKPIPHGVTKNN